MGVQGGVMFLQSSVSESLDNVQFERCPLVFVPAGVIEFFYT